MYALVFFEGLYPINEMKLTSRKTLYTINKRQMFDVLLRRHKFMIKI